MVLSGEASESCFSLVTCEASQSHFDGGGITGETSESGFGGVSDLNLIGKY